MSGSQTLIVAFFAIKDSKVINIYNTRTYSFPKVLCETTEKIPHTLAAHPTSECTSGPMTARTSEIRLYSSVEHTQLHEYWGFY